MLPVRDRASHKGMYGTLVCVCGSRQYVGAALLAASAATRGGAGLVALAVQDSLVPLFAGRVLESVTLPLPEAAFDVDADAALEAITARGANALLVGCGLRESEGFRRLVVALVGQPPPDPEGAAREGPVPLVIDGGALNLLARSGEWWLGARRECVLTPHPGEFARLTGRVVGAGDDERAERAAMAAETFGQVIVLKGARTIVAAPDGRSAVAPFANPALATAGTGDVLAGLIGAFLAQGLHPFEAACLGVYLHGAAGERIRSRLGDAGLVASDLPYEIALVRHDLSRSVGA
jgi:hydroxyethylthiazole kinase-like uncharacterized protein yjeF